MESGSIVKPPPMTDGQFEEYARRVAENITTTVELLLPRFLPMIVEPYIQQYLRERTSMAPTNEELERRFTYHPPTDPTVRALHDDWRNHEKWYATHINDLPGGESREKSLALTALEEATFWVHAHIARNLHETGLPE